MMLDPMDACIPHPLDEHGFNSNANIPYDCTIQHIQYAMRDFLGFLGFMNAQLHGRGLPRLETMLMPASFSGMVGEFMGATIPKYCLRLVRNRFHNGHPDLIPAERFSNDAVQYSHEGIEIKASRYNKGWQGHNPEAIWLMVFGFTCNTSADEMRAVPSHPFRFKFVFGAQLTLEDWAFSGRSATSRRTITASVTKSGYDKMASNWIYKDSSGNG